MTHANQMTMQEIHEFGIEIVFNQLKKEGYEIQSVNTEFGMNPQIVGKKRKSISLYCCTYSMLPRKRSTRKASSFSNDRAC